MTPGRNEIYPLTSLRFLAAALVLLQHLPMLPGLEPWRPPGGCFGIAGVSIFFVLSGYILSYTYWNKDWAQSFASNAREFYWSRFARIYPLHWLTFLIALPLGLNSISARTSLADFPSLLTLTDRLWPGNPIVSQPVKAAWTLSCEALFYLATPPLFLLLGRIRQPLLGASGTWILATGAVVLLEQTRPDLNWSAYLRLPDFLLGVVVYHLAKRIDLSRAGNPVLVVGLATIVIGGRGALATAHLEYQHFAYAPGAALIILGCAYSTGAVARVLSLPGLVLLGHASYALYLLQDPALRYARVLLVRTGVSMPFPVNVVVGALAFAGIAVAAIACFKCYENPARLRLRAWMRRRVTREQPGSDGGG